MMTKEEKYLDNLDIALRCHGLNVSQLSLYPSQQSSTIKGSLHDQKFVLSFSPIGAMGADAHSIVFNIDPIEDHKEIDIIKRLNEYFGILPAYRFSMLHTSGIFYEWQRGEATKAKKEYCVEFLDLRFPLLNLFEARCRLLDSGVKTGWLKAETFMNERNWIKGGLGDNNFFMKLGAPDINGKFPSTIICLSEDDQKQIDSFSKFIGDEPFACYKRWKVRGLFYEWTSIENQSTYDHLIDDIGKSIFDLKIF